MVTKTLILRPYHVSGDSSKISLYPSDTTMRNAHTLVNEEVADNDATYISITSAGGMAYYHFSYEKPDDLVAINTIQIFTVDKLESGNNFGTISLSIDEEIVLAMGDGELNTTEYNEYVTQVSVTNKVLELMHDGFYDFVTFTFGRGINSNSSKASPLRTTQVYMEITYEAIEPDVISIKNNNEWATIDYTSIYYKINDKWTPSGTFILQNNHKYVTKEVE